MILFLFAVGSTGAGIPDNVVSIIRSFHSCISAIVQCGDVVTDPISVRNRPRQGCTIACILVVCRMGLSDHDPRPLSLIFRNWVGEKKSGPGSCLKALKQFRWERSVTLPS